MSLLRRTPALDSGIFSLFEASGSNAQRACELLRDMLRDFPERSELARDILKCEQDGDRITHDIILTNCIYVASPYGWVAGSEALRWPGTSRGGEG